MSTQLSSRLAYVLLIALFASTANAQGTDHNATLAGESFCGHICGAPPIGSGPWWSQWELLLYFAERDSLPSLVTTSDPGTPDTDLGIMGLPTTQTMYGGKPGSGFGVGGRLTVGRWLNDFRGVGVQGEFFMVDGDSYRFSAGNGDAIITRPFHDVVEDAYDAEIVNMPGLVNGYVNVNGSSRIYSAAPALRLNLNCFYNTLNTSQQARLDVIGGYRFFQLRDSLEIYEQFEPDNGQFANGTFYEFSDNYRTSNNFHGGEIGLNWTRQFNRYYVDLLGSVAIGAVSQRVSGQGYSHAYVPDAIDETMAGGFYTSDPFAVEDQDFAVLPQGRIKLGYCVSRNFRLFAGYDFLYLSSVVRPGAHIDRRIDPNALLTDAPDPNLSKRELPEEGFWLHGTTVGMLLKF